MPHPTRQFTPATGFPVVEESTAEPDDESAFESEYDSEDESDFTPRQFAGIDLDEFIWARQRSRRAVVFWVLTVLVLTGLVAIAAWTVGLNLNGILPPR